MLSFDTKNIRAYNHRLQKIRKDGIPLAVAATLDNMAFTARKISIKEFEQDHIIRSSWTQRGMLYSRTRKAIPIRQMESRSGSIREYAPTLEHGGTEKPETGSSLQIPALGARVGKSKQKKIARRFTIPQLQSIRRLPTVSGNAKRKFAAMLNIARREKYMGPFLVTKQDAAGERLPVGIFNLSGAGRLRRDGGTITMIRKLQSTAVVHGHPFIEPAGRRVGRQMDRIYIRNARQVLKKYSANIR